MDLQITPLPRRTLCFAHMFVFQFLLFPQQRVTICNHTILEKDQKTSAGHGTWQHPHCSASALSLRGFSVCKWSEVDALLLARWIQLPSRALSGINNYIGLLCTDWMGVSNLLVYLHIILVVTLMLRWGLGKTSLLVFM